MCVPLSARRSVCPYVTSRYCIETTGRIELIVGIGLPSTDPTLCYKEIWVSPIIRVLPYWTLCQTLDLENFTTASQSRRQQNSLLSSSTVEFVDNAYTTVVAVYYKSVNCNPLTPLRLTAICCGFVVQLVSTVDKILIDIASRDPSVVAQLLV